jgi:heptosyltransferase-2
MPHKILIIGPAWIGDMIMAETLFKCLKKQYADVIIHVLAPAWTLPLLERMPEVDLAIASPFRHRKLDLIKRYRLGKTLRAENYDQAIVLQNSWKSALVPFFANIPKRTGWLGECRYFLLNDWRKLDKKKYPMMIERFMALGISKNKMLEKPYPIPSFSIDKHSVKQALDKYRLDLKKPILALCPGAQYGEAKQWPPEYFATIALQKIQEGWQVWLFGSKDDQMITKKINAITREKCVDLSGKTSLSEAIDLLSCAKTVVANDSGLMHVAAALHLNLIAIYGSSAPEFTPPLSDNAKIISLNLSCSPCFKRQCPLKHFNCMKELKPKMILELL